MSESVASLHNTLTEPEATEIISAPLRRLRSSDAPLSNDHGKDRYCVALARAEANDLWMLDRVQAARRGVQLRPTSQVPHGADRSEDLTACSVLPRLSTLPRSWTALASYSRDISAAKQLILICHVSPLHAHLDNNRGPPSLLTAPLRVAATARLHPAGEER